MKRTGVRAWSEPDQLLKQPPAAHWSSNPVIDLDGDTATAETDMLVVKRDETGRAGITLVARYRDREWARAFDRMSEETRAKFRLT
jgi:hypothetical protein